MSIHQPSAPPSAGHFTPFFSAAEEDSWDNEGGHMSSLRGRVVCTPGAPLRYAAILTHHGRAESARAFATMREAEAFIRRNTPVPPPRSTLYDRAAGDS
jgi:hypothetical protein